MQFAFKLCLIIHVGMFIGCANSKQSSLTGSHDLFDRMQHSAAEKNHSSEMHHEDWYDEASQQGRGVKKRNEGEDIRKFDDIFSSSTARSIEQNLGYDE